MRVGLYRSSNVTFEMADGKATASAGKGNPKWQNLGGEGQMTPISLSALGASLVGQAALLGQGLVVLSRAGCVSGQLAALSFV